MIKKAKLLSLLAISIVVLASCNKDPVRTNNIPFAGDDNSNTHLEYFELSDSRKEDYDWLTSVEVDQNMNKIALEVVNLEFTSVWNYLSEELQLDYIASANNFIENNDRDDFETKDVTEIIQDIHPSLNYVFLFPKVDPKECLASANFISMFSDFEMGSGDYIQYDDWFFSSPILKDTGVYYSRESTYFVANVSGSDNYSAMVIFKIKDKSIVDCDIILKEMG